MNFSLLFLLLRQLPLAGVGWIFIATSAVCAGQNDSVQDVTFTAKCDGTKQNYLLIAPQELNALEPHHLLVLLHGHGSDRWQAMDASVEEFRAGRECAAARQMIVVAPDYRAKTSWMGPKAEADLLQIIAEVKARFHVGKVIVSGASMGGSSALTFAALHPELVDGVVSLNGTANLLEFDNFQDAIRQSFGGAKAEIPLEYKKRSAEYWPERLKMPIAITAGGNDATVPAASVVRLAGVVKKIQPNVLLIYRDNGGHSTNYEDSKAAFEFVLNKAIPANTPSAISNK